MLGILNFKPILGQCSVSDISQYDSTDQMITYSGLYTTHKNTVELLIEITLG